MLIQEPVAEKPKHPLKHADYEQDCREALRPHLYVLSRWQEKPVGIAMWRASVDVFGRQERQV
jgi:hypothetical protein